MKEFAHDRAGDRKGWLTGMGQTVSKRTQDRIAAFGDHSREKESGAKKSIAFLGHASLAMDGRAGDILSGSDACVSGELPGVVKQVHILDLGDKLASGLVTNTRNGHQQRNQTG